MKAQNKQDKTIVDVTIVDFVYDNIPFSGYYIDKYDLIYTERQFHDLYDIVEDKETIINQDNSQENTQRAVNKEDKETLEDRFYFLKDCYYIDEDGQHHRINAIPELNKYITQEKARLVERVEKLTIDGRTDGNTCNGFYKAKDLIIEIIKENI